MIEDPYSARVRQLFAVPAHAGDIDDGACAYIHDQGVRIALSARIEDGRLAAVRFRAWGCPHLLAAAEAACDQLEGRPTDALDSFSGAELMQTLAVPREKLGRILVLEDAVRSLGQSVRRATHEESD